MTAGQELVFGNKAYENNTPEADYRIRIINYGQQGNEVLKSR